MMLFHVPTIYVMTLLVMTLLGCLMIFAWAQNRAVRSLLWWGAGNLLLASSLGLLCLRGHIPQFFSLDLAYVTLFCAAGMILQGARVFEGKRASMTLLFGGSALWIAFFQFPALYESVTVRTVVVSALISFYVGGCSVEFFLGRRERLLSRWPLIVILGMNSLLFAVRIPLALFYPLAQSAVNSVEALQSPWFAAASASVLLFNAAMNFLFLAMVKERAEQVQKLAADTDPLTGLLNRRAFLERAERIATDGEASLAMLDLDRFKQINDRFGHEVGDEVLRRFAAVVRGHERSGLIAGRLGGEEFAVVASAQPDLLRAYVDVMRKDFARAAAMVGAEKVAATFSAGVSCARDLDLQDLLRDADRALYLAKAGGRNRVLLDDEAAGIGVTETPRMRRQRSAA